MLHLLLTALLSLLGVVEAPQFPEPETPLLNGVDFSGWKRFLPDESKNVDDTWKAKEGGVYWCSGVPAGYMRTETKQSNYRLSLEWRWPGEGGNNGVLVHVQDKDEVWPKSIEIQLQHKNAGDFWVIGGADFKEHTSPVDRRVPKRHNSSEKALGEWNRGEIVCKDNRIEVYINGVLQNIATECTVSEGYIALQSEGTPIEYRNLRIEALPGSAGN